MALEIRPVAFPSPAAFITEPFSADLSPYACSRVSAHLPELDSPVNPHGPIRRRWALAADIQARSCNLQQQQWNSPPISVRSQILLNQISSWWSMLCQSLHHNSHFLHGVVWSLACLSLVNGTSGVLLVAVLKYVLARHARVPNLG